jgi:hypothetical protein
MMPDRIGIIGSTQGVKASRRPKPKKLAMSTARCPWKRRAITPSSAPAGASARSPDGASAVEMGAAPVRLTCAFCTCGT